jgi:hypothetical protein
MANVSTMSLAGLANWLASDGIRDAYKATLGFVGDVTSVEDDELASSIADEPRLLDDDRVNALLAAVAEHLAFHRNIATPAWCQGTHRFLDTAWFPVDLPSIRIRALVSSPASFWRRLIFIDRSDLQRV